MSNNEGAINISRKNITNKCDLKCAYSYHYPSSNVTAKNNKINIALTYENGPNAPVTYNGAKYTVHQINIFSPSLHTFDGMKAPGELIIVHIPELGGPNLLVCIPFIQSGDTTSGSNLITQVIESVANHAPRKGESTNLNMSSFSLEQIVPKKPFISYSGKYDDVTTDFIVFPILAPIPLTQSTLEKLRSIIQPFPLPMYGGPLYFNSKGPNTGMIFKNNDIYIACNPTGASEQQTSIQRENNQASSNSTVNLFNNPIFMYLVKFLIICVVFIAFFSAINYAFNYFTSTFGKSGAKT
jgi:carbonic anhydrase